MLAPWRKNFPLCKPLESIPTKEQAARFLKDFIDGSEDVDAGTSGNWTLADVANGEHEGGRAATAVPADGAGRWRGECLADHR